MASLLLLLLYSLHVNFDLSHASAKPVILPLMTQKIAKISSLRTPDRLLVHHNVSLTISLSIGTPPQNVTMVIDTGSELSWLLCNQSQNSFNPLMSSTYTPIPFSSDTCQSDTQDLQIPPSSDTQNRCHVFLSYADASSSEGTLATDTFMIGDSLVNDTVFGCMSSSFSSSPDTDSRTTGLIGMNRGSLSFVTQTQFSKFSYCISDLDSTGVLLLGEANFTWLQPLNYTPLIQISDPLPYYNRVAYSVELQGLMVSNKELQLPKSVFEPDHTGAGQTMVDSGTQFTFLLGPVYTALRNEFLSQTKGVLRVLNDTDFVFQGAMDLCFRVSPFEKIGALPPVTLLFRGAEMVVSGNRLLYRVRGLEREGDSIYCFTFGNSDLVPLEAYIIGHHHQHNMWVEYDLENSKLGFAHVQCDAAGKTLGTSA